MTTPPINREVYLSGLRFRFLRCEATRINLGVAHHGQIADADAMALHQAFHPPARSAFECRNREQRNLSTLRLGDDCFTERMLTVPLYRCRQL